MSERLSRAQLLRGVFRGTGDVLRPPFALPEDDFTDVCTRSNACARACPEGIVVRGRAGFPEIDFAKGGCTFCYSCVRACSSGALDAKALGTPDRPGRGAPWAAHAVVDGSCLSARGVSCRTCGEVCGPRAIRFRLAVGGAAYPEIDVTACDGCGACVRPCPVGAVRVSPVS